MKEGKENKSEQVDFNRFKITGTVTRVYELNKRSERFQKQEFSIRFTDVNPFNNKIVERVIKFTLINEDIKFLDSEFVDIDDQVEVFFYVDGRDYEKDGKTNNFTSLAAIGIVNLDMDNKDRSKRKTKETKEEDPRDVFNKSLDDAFSSSGDDIFSLKNVPDNKEKTNEDKDNDNLNEAEKEGLDNIDQALQEDKENESDSALDEFDDLPF
jgi:hypothetical protein